MKYNVPFTYIAGQGLGTAQSSLAQIGPIDGSPSPLGQAHIQGYINVSTDNVVVYDYDSVFTEKVMGLHLGFVYNSQAAAPQPCWKLSMEKRLLQQPDTSAPGKRTAQLLESDGHITNFSYDPDFGGDMAWTSFNPKNGINYIIFDDASQQWLLYRLNDKLIERYDTQGLLQSISNYQKQQLDFGYDAQQRLTAIIGPSGCTYSFERPDEQTLYLYVQQTGAEKIRWVSYSLDEQQRITTTTLTQSTNPYSIKYTYNDLHANGPMSDITQTDGSNLHFQRNISTGRLERMSYGDYDQTITHDAEHNRVIISSADNREVVLTLDEQQRIIAIQRPLGFSPPDFYGRSAATQYSYHPVTSQLGTITHEDGSTETFEPYGVSLNYLLKSHTKRKPDGSLADSPTTYHYNGGLQSCITIKSRSLQDGTTTVDRFCWQLDYGANQITVLRYAISPAGRITEYRYDDDGMLTSTRVYLGNTFDTSYPPTLAPSIIAMDELVASFNPANIKLVDATHNNHGELIKQKQYATVDADGAGIQDLKMGVDEHDWDMHHQCIRRFTLRDADPEHTLARIINMRYDDLSRRTRSLLFIHDIPAGGRPSDDDQVISTHNYLDDQQQIQSIDPVGRETIQSYNQNGTVNKKVETAISNGITQSRQWAMWPDLGGRPVTIVQDGDHHHFVFYDMRNHIGYRVSALGCIEVKEYFPETGYQTHSVFAKAIDTKTLFPSKPPTEGGNPDVAEVIKYVTGAGADPEHDAIDHTFFDSCDRTQYEVNADGYITEHRYDDLGQKISTIDYATVISQDELSKLKTGAILGRTADDTNDRIHNRFYNANGELIAQQDAAGYVIEHRRDIAGNDIETIAYANKMPHGTTWANVKPEADPAHDAHHFHFFDLKGQKTLSVDPEGYVSTYTYAPNGYCVGEYSYYNKVNPSWYDDTSQPPGLPGDHSEDRNLSYHHDERGKLLRKTDPFGLCETFSYDKLENQTSHQCYDGRIDTDPTATADPDKARSNYQRYDQWGQLTHELPANIGQLVAQINSNGQLSPAEKEEQIEALWQSKAIQHHYDPNGLKQSTTTSMGHQTRYYYDNDRRLTLTIDPMGAVTQHSYNTQSKINQTRHYLNFVDTSTLPEQSDAFESTALLALLMPSDDDPVDTFSYDRRGNKTQHIDPDGYITTYHYNAFGVCDEEQHPVNSQAPSLKVSRTFDQRGNCVETSKQDGVDGPTITSTSTYNNLHNKCDQATDAEDNPTWYQYDRRGCLVKHIDATKVATHQFTYDALQRVLTDTLADGSTTTHSYNQQQQTHQIDHPESGTVSLTTHNVFGEATQQQNALQIENKVATTFTHDALGHVVSTTNALGGSDQDQYDDDHRHIRHIDGNGIRTGFAFNSAGYLEKKVVDEDTAKYTTIYTLDALGRQEKITDPRNTTTKNSFYKSSLLNTSTRDYGTDTKPGFRTSITTAYNAQAKRTLSIQGDSKEADQYSVAWQHDGFGRLTKKTVDPNNQLQGSGLAQTQQSAFDKLDRVIKRTDPLGNIERTFFDERGLKRFAVGADNNVTEWTYNTRRQRTTRRSYAARIPCDDSATLASLSANASKVASDSDTISYFYFDNNGHERFAISCTDINENGQPGSFGMVVEKRYDMAERMACNIAYATSIDASNLTQASTADIEKVISTLNNKDDRGHHYVYDLADRKRFDFRNDASNTACSVTEYIYNQAGQVIQEIQYGAFVDPSAYLNQKPDAINIPDNPASPNRIKYYAYNALKKPLYVVDNNQVTYHLHDPMGVLEESCIFKDPISVPDTYEGLLAKLAALTPDRSKDRCLTHAIDALGRIATTTDALGNADHFTHDALGQMRIHKDRAKQQWLYDYDRLKRLNTRTSPTLDVTDVRYGTTHQLTASDTSRSIIEQHEWDLSNNAVCITKDSGESSSRALHTSYTALNMPEGTTIKQAPLDDPSQPASLSTLPIQHQDISEKKVYNGKAMLVAKQNKNGSWEFYIHDAAGRQIFTVQSSKDRVKATQHILNCFGDVRQRIQYKQTLSLDTSQYQNTGIPLDVLLKAITANPALDRNDHYEHNGRGQVMLSKGDPQCWCLPDKDTMRHGMDTPKTTYINNAFGERLIIRKQRFPGCPQLDELTRNWWDNHGQCIAVACAHQSQLENNSLIESPVSYVITEQQFDNFGNNDQSLAWANAVTIPELNEQTTLEALKALYVADPTDRKTIRSFDLLGQKTNSTKIQATRQTPGFASDGKTPKPRSQTLDLSKQHFYDSLGSMVKTITADQGISYYYHDALKRVIAIAGPKLSTQSADGTKVVHMPFVRYNYNAHGQRVWSRRYANGVDPDCDEHNMPVPKEDDTHDQITITFFDPVRGTEMITQAPEGGLKFSFVNASGKVSRSIQVLTNFDPDSESDPQKVTEAMHLVETQKQRDGDDHVVLIRKLWDSDIKDEVHQNFNTFDECIAQSDETTATDKTSQAYTTYGQNGHEWTSNLHEQGKHVLTLRDLTGKPSVLLSSADTNLADKTADDIPSLLTMNGINKQSHWHNPRGASLRDQAPTIMSYQNGTTQTVQLALGSQHSAGQTMVIWPQITGVSRELKLSVWPSSDVTKKQELAIVNTTEGMSTAILPDEWCSDHYQYEIDFILIDSTSGLNRITHKATGMLAINTGNDNDSKHLIAIASQPAKLWLVGDTSKLTAIQLVAGAHTFGPFAVQPDGSGRGFSVDLYDQEGLPSGEYTILGVRGSSTDTTPTVPVRLFTKTPTADKSVLPRLIDYQAELVTDDKLVTCAFWQHLDADLAQLPAQLKIQYTATDGKSYQQQATLTKSKPSFACEQAIDKIEQLSLALVLDASNVIEIYQNAAPISKELHATSYTSYRHHIRTTEHHSIRSSISSDDIDEWEDIEDASTQSNYHFAAGRLSYLSPLPGYAGKSPVIEYLDLSLATAARWLQLPTATTNQLGMAVDVTALPTAVYPWRIQGVAATFTYPLQVDPQAMAAIGDPNSPLGQQAVQPKQDFVLDAWHNQTAITDGEGNTFVQTFNDLNKITSKQKPTRTVVTAQFTFEKQQGTEYTAYNVMGQPFATTDAAGLCTMQILNEWGLLSQDIQPSGIISKSNLYNPLQQASAYRDSNGKLWQQAYDRNNAMIQSTTPLGRNFGYGYNQRGERRSETDPAGNIRRYGYGTVPKQRTLEQAPEGQITLRTFHRSGSQLSQLEGSVAGTGNTLNIKQWTIVPDFFGKTNTETLMDGTIVTHAYNNEAQPTHIGSNAQRRNEVTLTVGPMRANYFSYYDVPRLSAPTAVPAQSLEMKYSGGKLIAMINGVDNTLVQYSFDARSIRVGATHTLGNSGTIRTVYAVYDETGQVIFFFDTQASLFMVPDIAGRSAYEHLHFQPTQGSAIDFKLGSTWRMGLPEIVQGQWHDGSAPTLADGIGSQYGYDAAGRRSQEEKITQGATMTSALGYDNDSRLTTTQSKDGSGAVQSSTNRTYATGTGVATYTEDTPSYKLSSTITSNKNDWQIRMDQTRSNKAAGRCELANGQQTSATHAFSNEGLPLTQTVDPHQDNISIDYARSYDAFQSQMPAEVNATTHDGSGSRACPPAIQYYDVNRHANARVGTDDGHQGQGNDFKQMSIFFENSVEGIPLTKWHMPMGSSFFEWISGSFSKDFAFAKPDGGIFASYADHYDPRDNLKLLQAYLKNRGDLATAGRIDAELAMISDIRGEGDWELAEQSSGSSMESGRHYRSGYGRSYASLLNERMQGMDTHANGRLMLVDGSSDVVMRPRPQTLADYEATSGSSDDAEKHYQQSIPRPATEFPAQAVSNMTPSIPMTAVQIANQVYHLSSLASAIISANGWPADHVYQTSEHVKIPQVQLLQSPAAGNQRMQVLMSAYMGSLSNHLLFAQPKQHHSCFKTFVHVFISVVAVAIGMAFPELGPIIDGLISAVSDAALQGAAKELHLIDHFSWSEVLSAGIAGYTGASGYGKGVLDSADKLSTAEKLAAVEKLAATQAAINLSEQAVRMALGLQKSFEFKSVLQAMVGSIIDSGVQLAGISASTSDPYTYIVEQTAITLSKSVLTAAIMGAPIDIEQLASSALASTLGGMAGQEIQHSIASARRPPMPSDPAFGNPPASMDSKAAQDYQAAAAYGQGTTPGAAIATQSQDAYTEQQLHDDSLDNTDNRPIGSMTDRQAMVVSEPTAEDQHVQATNYFNAEQMYQAYLAQDPVRVAANDAFDQAMARTTFDTPMQAANVVPIKQPQNQAGKLSTLARLGDGAMGVLWAIPAVTSGIAAVLTSETVVGGVAFGAGSAYSADHALQNFREAYTGKPQETLQTTGLVHLGVSSHTAHIIDNVEGLVVVGSSLFPVAKRLGGAALARWGLFGRASKGLVELDPAIIRTTQTTGKLDRGVTFFSKDKLHYFAPDSFEGTTNIGAPSKPLFLMPAEDAAKIRTPVNAAIETGFAPSVQQAWLNGEDIYGLSFPLKGLSPRLPTIEDAMGNINFRSGGFTAIGSKETNMFLVNSTRERVITGGMPMPKGSVVFRLGDEGEWVPMWRFK